MDVQSLIILHLLIPTDYGKIEMLHIQIYRRWDAYLHKKLQYAKSKFNWDRSSQTKTTAARELTQGPLKQMDGIALNGPGLL
jgi:hypothetical protein